MGINLIGSSSVNDRSYPPTIYNAPAPPNPNPFRYRIVRSVTYGEYLIVELIYPDATNYEGRKILVYYGVTLAALERPRYIDPHFSEQGFAPIARFEPTEIGWNMALRMCSTFVYGE